MWGPVSTTLRREIMRAFSRRLLYAIVVTLMLAAVFAPKAESFSPTNDGLPTNTTSGGGR